LQKVHHISKKIAGHCSVTHVYTLCSTDSAVKKAIQKLFSSTGFPQF